MDHILQTNLLDADTLCVTTKCPFCHAQQIIHVSAQGFTEWQRGFQIQNALPLSTPDEREALITGICAQCFPSDDDVDGEPDPAIHETSEDAHIDSRIE